MTPRSRVAPHLRRLAGAEEARVRRRADVGARRQDAADHQPARDRAHPPEPRRRCASTTRRSARATAARLPDFADRDLRRLFSDSPVFRDRPSAASFLRRVRSQVTPPRRAHDRRLPVRRRPGARGHHHALPQPRASPDRPRGGDHDRLRDPARRAHHELAHAAVTGGDVKPLRVLALMDERRIPPDEPGDDELTTADWKTEYDVTVTLERLGHEVHNLGVGGDLSVIRRTLDEVKPHVVFNLLEDFHDVPIYDQNVVSYLEMLRTPYTGCNPRGLMLARDKALSKTLLASHRIPVPEFAVFRLGRAVRRPRRLAFPLIVKSLTKEGSDGHRAGLDRRQRRAPRRARALRARAPRHARHRRALHRRARALRRRDRQRPPAGLPGLGAAVRAAARGRAAHRHRARQVEPRLPGEGRRQDRGREGPARRAARAHRRAW